MDSLMIVEPRGFGAAEIPIFESRSVYNQRSSVHVSLGSTLIILLRRTHFSVHRSLDPHAIGQLGVLAQPKSQFLNHVRYITLRMPSFRYFTLKLSNNPILQPKKSSILPMPQE